MISNSKEETIELGEKIGKLLDKGSVVFLNGEMSCGKTILTKGIGKGLGVKEVINSPTFTIMKIYYGRFPLYHMDAYRLEDAPSIDLGLDEYDDGVFVVEWPKYYENYLPKEYLEITILNPNFDESKRIIEFNYKGDKYKKIIEALNV